MSELSYSEQIERIDELNQAAWGPRRGDARALLALTDEAYSLAQGISYRRGVGLSLRNSGAVLKVLGEIEQATHNLHAAIEVLKEEGLAADEATVHLELGLLYQDSGSYDLSMEHFVRALMHFEQANDLWGQARCNNNIGNIDVRLGRLDEAVEHFREAERLHKLVGNRPGHARALSNLGRVYMFKGDYDTSLRYTKAGLAELASEGLHLDVILATSNFAQLLTKLGRYAEAVEVIEISKKHAEEQSYPLGLADNLFTSGVLRTEMGEYDSARMELMAALEFAIGAQARVLQAEIVDALSVLEERAGDIASAMARARQLLEMERNALREQQKTSTTLRLYAMRHDKELQDQDTLLTRNRFLESENVRLLELNEHKDEVLRIVSHDMRTPLGTMIGMGNLIRTEGAQDAEELSSFGELIEESGTRLLTLVNSLLEVAHAESDAFHLNLSAVHLCDLLSNSIDQHRALGAKKDIQIDFDDCAESPILSVDALKMGQVFNNILSNAIKFTPIGGRIQVYGELGDTALCIHFRDSGIGIPEEDMSRLFDKFGKHQRRGTIGEKGTGLGMPIVKRFVELHGGRVRASSEVGIGTTVTVELPLGSQPEVVEVEIAEEELLAVG